MTRRQIEAALLSAGIAEARTEAGLLLAHFSGLSPAALLAEPSFACTDPALSSAVARRVAREPLAYILGETWFCRERYAVSPACLIPRPDTECLVEYAVEHLPQGAFFADFCTGSGCIAISVLAARPDCRAVALDVSPAALALARENAVANAVADRLTFQEVDLLSDPAVWTGPRYDMILSNPPYLSATDFDHPQPEILHEPHLALAGGADGLTFYRHFIEHGRAITPIWLLEIGAAQGASLCRLAEEAAADICLLPDYAGRDRLARVTYRPR